MNRLGDNLINISSMVIPTRYVIKEVQMKKAIGKIVVKCYMQEENKGWVLDTKHS